MKHRLIKLQDEFILVNDEEIKEGAWNIIPQPDGSYKRGIYSPLRKWIEEGYDPRKDGCKKIISENPDLSLLKEEDCKTIGWVDVEKLAPDYASLFQETWKEGFKTAQSLNDKQFSLEQVMKAIDMARDINEGKDNFTAEDISGCTEVCTYGWKNRYSDSDIIQSLQQKSWEVEVNEHNQITKIL